MKKTAKKDTTNTTPVPDALTAAPTNDSDPGFDSLQLPIFIEESQFLCHLHHHKKKHLIIKLIYTIPLSPTLFPMFNLRLPPNPLARQYQTPHIH